MKVLVSTDSSCLINYEILKKNNVSLFPLNVIIDGVEYLDNVTIKQDELLKAMNDKKTIKTSTPALGMVIEYFENLFSQGYDKIIHFTISSRLSSMYNLFKSVSKSEFDDKVIVIDSYCASALMLSHVLYAVDELNKGTDIETIVKNIEKRKEKSYICFMPKDLNALKNGGRISPAVAAIGNTLGLKPVISLTNGELIKDTMATNMKKKFKDIFNSRYEKFKEDEFDYTIVSFDGDEVVVNALTDHIENVINTKVLKGIIPINVCAHCGPGTIGLVASPKINGKSISEFN